MKTLLTVLLAAIAATATGQVADSSTFLFLGGSQARTYEVDTVVVEGVANTSGGSGYRMVSGTDTAYIFAVGDTLVLSGDTILVDGYLALPASAEVKNLYADTLSVDTLSVGSGITYGHTPTRQPGSSSTTNVGAIYRDSSNVLQVDRCFPWTCNDSGDVIFTDTTDYLGIGTSEPSAALHVIGGVSLDSLNNKLRIGNDIGVDGFIDDGIVITTTYQDSIGLYMGGWYYEDEGRYEFGIRVDTQGILNANRLVYVPDANSYEWLGNIAVGGTGSNVQLTTNELIHIDGKQADGYVLTSDASGNATWQDHTAWGEMGFGDSTSTQALTQNVWHVITNPNEDLWKESVVDTHAVTYTNDSIVIQKNGTYALNVQLSVDGSASSIIRLGIYVNGSLACTCTGYQQLSNNEIVQINYINIDELSAGDVVQPVITNTANNNDVDAIAGKLTIHKID